MNEHIANPEVLYATLLRWLPVRALAPAATVERPSPLEPMPFDLAPADVPS